MSNINVPSQKGSQVAAAASIIQGGQSKGGRYDFKGALEALFQRPQKMMIDYGDTKTTTMEIEGFGTLDKSNSAAQLMIGVTLTKMETQLNTLLSIMEYSLKTFPQKADGLFNG